MILLIDAYNVLKQVKPSDIVDERERSAFIHELGRYAKMRQHKIILVFDGGPYDRISQERIADVYVIYSGVLESADDYIKRYLKKHKELDILLISSDRELRSTAARYHIESVQAPDFYAMMKDALRSGGQEPDARRGPAQKTSEEQDPELDAIMQEGSKVVPHKVEDVVEVKRSRKGKAHKPSKKERKKLKKIKKL